MKIVGVEGLSPENLRDEVARGARFVLYRYCISILVMTFRRPSNVYFIKPGGNRVIRGLPFDLISLVLGWWGFPWGPIYTVEALVDNLLGGKDVTGEILASLAPSASAPGPGFPPAMETTPAHAPAPAGPSQATKIAVGAAIVAGLALAIVCSICYYRSTQLTVVFVSGAPQSYAVEIDGVRHQLARGRPVVLTRHEGSFVATCGVPGAAPAAKTFSFSLPFFSHLSESRVAVINPDLCAIVYQETTVYYPAGAAPKPGARPEIQLFAGRMEYFLPAPDYVFTDFPRQIQMDQNASSATRTRLAQLTEATPEQQAALLRSKLGYASMLLHFSHLAAQQPEDEDLFRAAIAHLTPEDCRAWFERRLDDRPVLVEWHRYYQQFAQIRFPDLDLVNKYRGVLAADPDNGALRYLLGRISGNPEEMRTLYEQAIAAPQPCPYGYYGLGVSALDAADYPRALESLDSAGRHGVDSAALKYNRRLARIGTGDFEGLLADAAAQRKAAPRDLAAAGEAITCGLLAGRGKAAAETMKTEFLAQIAHGPQVAPKELSDFAAYLSALIAYGTNDAPGFAREIAILETPECSFQAAVSLGDHAAAAQALKKIPDAASNAFLLCYLVAHQGGDDRAAEAYFSQALERMAKEDRDSRQLAALLRQPVPPTVREIEAISVAAGEKRIIMTALACRYPQDRAAYIDWARRTDIDPAFPHLLIAQITTSARH